MLLARKHKRDRFMMSIHKEQKCFIPDRLKLKIDNVLGVSAQEHAETTHERRAPFFIAHFIAAGIEPHHILDLGPTYPPTPEKFRPPKDRMLAPKADQFFRELEERVLLFIALPIEPADLVVLAISVVVSLLRAAQFVAAAKHRHTLGKKKCGQKIPLLSFTQRLDLGIVSRSFCTAVP